MKRKCQSCGKAFEAKRATAKYCGGTCRVRASRGAAARPVTELPGPASVASGLEAAVRSELEAAERIDTVLGQAALVLARRLDGNTGDGPKDTGSAVAALTRELRATVAEATKGVGAPKSQVNMHRDELAARRRRPA